MVANHNTFQSRGALREVAKVHGRPAGEIREVTRRIPFFYETGERLDKLIATHPNFRGLQLASNWQDFARAAEGLVGDSPPPVGASGRGRDHAHAAHRLCAGGARRQDAPLADGSQIFRCRSSSSRRTAPRMPDW